MQRRRHRAEKSVAEQRRFLAVVAVISAIIAVLFINSALNPVIMDMAEQYGKLAVTEAVNNSVSDLFSNEDIGYSDIVRLSFGGDGFVTAVEYDTAAINRLKFELGENLVSNLTKLKSSKIAVPIGSTTGNVFFSGRGIKLRIRVMQSAVPEIELISSFESEGINTVLHRIIMRITVNASAYLLPKTADFTVTQEYVIAQTLIVGDIPSGYANIG